MKKTHEEIIEEIKMTFRNAKTEKQINKLRKKHIKLLESEWTYESNDAIIINEGDKHEYKPVYLEGLL